MAGGSARWKRERFRPHRPPRAQGGMGQHAPVRGRFEPRLLDAHRTSGLERRLLDARSVGALDPCLLYTRVAGGSYQRWLAASSTGGREPHLPDMCGACGSEPRLLDACSGGGTEPHRPEERGVWLDARGGGGIDPHRPDAPCGWLQALRVDGIDLHLPDARGGHGCDWWAARGVGGPSSSLTCATDGNPFVSWWDRLEKLERPEMDANLMFGQYSEFGIESDSFPEFVQGGIAGWSNSIPGDVDFVPETEAQDLMGKVDSDAETDDGSNAMEGKTTASKVELDTYEPKVNFAQLDFEDFKFECLLLFFPVWAHPTLKKLKRM